MSKNFLQVAAAGLILAFGCWVLWLWHVAPVPITRIYVETGSMEPVLHVGSEYACTPPALAPFDGIKVGYKIGNIVEFDATWTAKPVAHRAVRKTLDGIVTKGDANATEDPGFVTPINYRGTVQIP